MCFCGLQYDFPNAIFPNVPFSEANFMNANFPEWVCLTNSILVCQLILFWWLNGRNFAIRSETLISLINVLLNSEQLFDLILIIC